MALEAGTLRVTLQYAKDIKDCDWFGRQDPYAKLRVGNQERRSRMLRDGGRNPVWNETFDFGIINENTLEVILMDEDTLVRDDLIGSASINLTRVRQLGSDTVQAPLSDGKKMHKQRGFVQLSLAFMPQSGLRPGTAGAPYAAPYGAYGAPYGAAAPPAAYSYPAPAPAYGTCGGCGHAAVAPPPPGPAPGPYGYGYPPAPYAAPPSYGPSPSYAYSPSFAAPAPAPVGPPAGAPPSFGGPSAPPVYGVPAAAPPPSSYYPSVPAPPPPAPVYGGYPGAPSYYRS